jgi:hypothetical protein
MAGSRAEQLRRKRLLEDLARELAAVAGTGRTVHTRHRRTLRSAPFLGVRISGRRGRLQVYCISEAGRDAFLTDDGRLIVLDADAGVRGAARQLTGTPHRAPGAGHAAGHGASSRPGW